MPLSVLAYRLESLVELYPLTCMAPSALGILLFW